MQKQLHKVWIARLKQLLQNLRFPRLDSQTQTHINRELFYFNHQRCLIISLAIIALEIMNIINVVFFSNSGLTTQNNREYFAMYVFLLVSGFICLAIRNLLEHKPKILSRVYPVFTAFWLYWHVAISAMDLRRNPSITVFITGIFALSILVRLKPKEAFIILLSAYILLVILTTHDPNFFNSGIAINAFIVTFLAILISFSRYYSTIAELDCRLKLIHQAEHLLKDKQKLKLMNNQQLAILNHSKEMLFLWDAQTDNLTISNGVILNKADADALVLWLRKCKTESTATLSLFLQRAEAKASPVFCTPTIDDSGTILGAAGRIDKTM